MVSTLVLQVQLVCKPVQKHVLIMLLIIKRYLRTLQSCDHLCQGSRFTYERPHQHLDSFTLE